MFCTSSTPEHRLTLTDNVITRLSVPGQANRVLQVVLGTKQLPHVLPTSDNRCTTPFSQDQLYYRWSDDCGLTWEPTRQIDPTTLLQTSGDPYSLQVDNNGDGLLDFDRTGFDRQELYFDPFSGNTYITVGLGAPYNVDLLLVSRDRGETWEATPARIPETRRDPVVMTSTSNGRLFLFKCVGGVPRLYWSDNGLALFGGAAVRHSGAGAVDCGIVPSSLIAQSVTNRANGWDISRRASSSLIDNVRIAYSARADQGTAIERQIIRVVNVGVQREARCDVLDSPSTPLPGDCVIVTSSLTVDEAVPTPIGLAALHALQVSFAETDRMEYQPAQETGSDVAVLSWYRVAGAASINPTAQLKFANVRGVTRSAIEVLSRRGGNPYTWDLNLSPTRGPGNFMGDYRYGAFYFDGALNFMIPWSESETTTTNPNLAVYVNTIELQP